MTQQTILVTGGAGYIGSHVCHALQVAGFLPVVVDTSGTDLPWGVTEKVDIRDEKALKTVFETHQPVAVVHMAALADAGASVAQQDLYWDVNVRGTEVLLSVMQAVGCGVIVFSGSAAVYGEPQYVPVDEQHPTVPTNPYGETKLVGERLIKEAGVAYGILRYFNAAGLGESVGLTPPTGGGVLKVLMEVASGAREAFALNGVDHPTEDGTPERDFVHVADLARAHVLAVNKLLTGYQSFTVNLGSGEKVSLRQVAATVAQVTGREILVQEQPRRAGDISVSVAAIGRAYEVLMWRPTQSDLARIVTSLWKAWPKG